MGGYVPLSDWTGKDSTLKKKKITKLDYQKTVYAPFSMTIFGGYP